MWPRAITDAVGRLLRLDGRMLWRVDDTDRSKVVYFTFDDGPVPEVTPWVLDTLKHFGVKATFFCIGKNIAAHPDLFARLRAEGHTVGNHTWDHPSGWRTTPHGYYRNVLACQELTATDLFRPPYGRITNRQLAALRKRFQVVMWDVLAYDFEDGYTDRSRIDEVLRQVRPGSIIVFHDSVKCAERMRASMPVVVERLLAEGYRFAVLPSGRP
jgi:peptidoglycan/xylan/chitin deacetylase (PgdA/CDA1 family)